MRKKIFNIFNIYVFIISILFIFFTIFNYKYPCVINDGLGIEGCYRIEEYNAVIQFLMNLSHSIYETIKYMFIINVVLLVISFIISVIIKKHFKFFTVNIFIHLFVLLLLFFIYVIL